MPKPSDKERVSRKQNDIDAAEKVYKKWDQTYSPDLLERYYYGLQWQNDVAELDKRKYVINMFYPSLKVRQPSLLFFRPKVRIEPRPGRNDDSHTDIEARAKLQQDTVNTFIGNPDIAFNLETQLAVLDAQFRFGVVEVGYTADFIDNPNAGKPVLNDKNEPLTDGDGSEVTQPSKLVNQEGLYVKWVPGNTVRVSANAHNRLERCEWFAYYEWHYIADLKANPRYKNTSNLKATGQLKDSEKSETVDADADAHKNMVKVWKRWNLRREADGSRMRYVWVEGGDKFLLEEPYKIFPFAGLKFDERLDEWYPLPPTFNWISPQNELNETREQQRVHRKRFNRMFQALAGAFASEEEKAKWAEGEDGTLLEVTRDEAIKPIADAPLDPTVVRNIPQTKEDFREISGISGEERGVAEAETATQANIIQLQSRVRESFGRVQVAQWLSKIGTIMLETIREYMSLPFWIKVNVDLNSPDATQEALRVGYLWQQIEGENLGDMNFDISVDVESLSPVAEESERNSWLQMLTVITNPTLQIPLATSEVLLRKTVGYFGIKSEREISEIQKAMSMSLMVAAQQAMAQTQAKQGGTPGEAAPGPTPTNQDIQGQLQQQMPTPVM